MTVGDLRAIVSSRGPLTISVLGDSTGDEPGEWVDLWARDLSKRGTVTLHFWDGATDDWKAHPTVYPGPDRPITVWNGSRSGASYAYPLEHLDRIQPSKPSLTVLSFGHNPAPERADKGAAELLAAADAKWCRTGTRSDCAAEPVAGDVGGADSRQRCRASGLGTRCRLPGH